MVDQASVVEAAKPMSHWPVEVAGPDHSSHDRAHDLRSCWLVADVAVPKTP